jgi:O-antigen/teichoic acid export membrane protein
LTDSRRTDDGAQREATGAGVNLLALLAQAALPAFHVQLARMLGATGYGLYAWANAFVDMLSVLTLFGMDQAVQRQVALAADDDRKKAVAAVGTALRIVVVSGALVSLSIALAAPLVASAQGKPDLVPPLRMLALVPTFYHAATIFIVATQARQVMRWGFWTRGILQPLVLLALTTVVLQLGGGVGAAAAAVALGMGLTALAAAVFYGRELPLGPTVRLATTGQVDWDTVRYAVPLVLTNMAWAVSARIDAFFLGFVRDSADVGAYAACVLYVASASQIRGAFDPIVCALIPPALARGDIASLNVSIQRQTRWVALAVFPVCALFVGFGDPLLAIFGKDFARGATAMAILSVGHTVNAIALASFALPMGGHARYGALTAVLCVALQCVLLPTLVPRWGLTGAAISSAAGLIVAQTLQMTFAYRLTGVQGLSWGLLRIAGAAGGALLVGRLAFGALGGSLALRFFAGVGAAAIVYLALAASFALGPEERELLRGALARARRRASPQAS